MVIVAFPEASGLGGFASSVVAQDSATSASSDAIARDLPFMILSLPFFGSLWLDAARTFRLMFILCANILRRAN